jgi:aspartate racemase
VGCELMPSSSSIPSGVADVDHQLPTGTVGILGGLGPLAGAHFYRRLIEHTHPEGDSWHLPVILVSDPTIPSRVDNLLGDGLSPVVALVHLAQLLESAGACVIAIPSSTTHAYYEAIQEAVGVPVLNLLSEVAAVIVATGYQRPALLATTATASLDLYRPYLTPQADPIYPDATSQDEIQELVASLKGGGDPGLLSGRLSGFASRPWAQGADSIVLACTELCLFNLHDLKLPVLSSTDVLADALLKLVASPKPGHESH